MKQIIKLENGMFVICPEGEVASYLTNGKKYDVFDVEEYENDGIVGYSFNIKDDDEEEILCVIHDVYGCAQLNNKHWIIDNPEKP